jgi:hypothetical protein
VETVADDWKDISTEEWREYQFAKGEKVRIEKPLRFKASAHVNGDAHRVEAADGRGHYVASGWFAIRWQVKAGAKTVTV